MNDIEVLKVVANALRESADEVAGMQSAIVGPFTHTALVVTGAANRIYHAAAGMNDERDKQARRMLAGLGINVPEFAAHKHAEDEHTGLYHDHAIEHNGYRQHWHYRDPDGGNHVGYDRNMTDPPRYPRQHTGPVQYSSDLDARQSGQYWQRVAMALIAQLDDLTHAAVKVSTADALGIEGLHVCWRASDDGDSTIYWLEDRSVDR